MSKANTLEFLNDLIQRRGIPSVGYDPTWFIELHGGTVVEPLPFPPDAATHRHDYYYNATNNTLYRKVISRQEPGIIVAHWQKSSD